LATNRASDTLDVVGIFVKEGESDCTVQARADVSGQNMERLRDQLRADIGQLAMSVKQPEHIPFVIAGHNETSWTYANTFNAQMVNLAADDPYTGFVSVNNLTRFPRRTSDAAHLNILGVTNLGLDWFQEWIAVREAATSATAVSSSRPTLAQIRQRAFIRAERNDVGNGATSAQVDQFINDSLREFYNTIGENAYFSRLIKDITVNVHPTTTTLPRPIHRLLRLEDTTSGADLRWKLIGYDEEGKQIIRVHDVPSGTVRAHYMTTWNDLEKDDDRLPVPNEYSELIVLLTVKRMTESFGNAVMMKYFASEVERLYKTTKRDILRADRGRHGALSTDEPDPWHSPRPQNMGW
jgi:hypothetical protein